MTAFPKPRRIQDRDYLQFVRAHPCLIKQCWRKPSAHHVRFPGQGGLGTKPSDFQTVPLCEKHHRQEHDLGRERFEAEHGLTLFVVIIGLLTEYIEGL